MGICVFFLFASLKLIFWAILTTIRNNILYYTFLVFCIVLTVRFYFTIICRYGLRLLQLVEISTVEGLLVAVRAHHLLQPPCHLRTLFAWAVQVSEMVSSTNFFLAQTTLYIIIIVPPSHMLDVYFNYALYVERYRLTTFWEKFTHWICIREVHSSGWFKQKMVLFMFCLRILNCLLTSLYTCFQILKEGFVFIHATSCHHQSLSVVYTRRIHHKTPRISKTQVLSHCVEEIHLD